MPRAPVHLHAEPGLLNWPMGLTMLRLLLLPVFLYLLLTDARTPDHSNRWWAFGIFAVMAATDKLDGWLARRLNQTSKIGQLLDPIADKLLIMSSVILLNFDWIAPAGYRIPLFVVVCVYAKDVVVAGGALALLSLVGTVKITPRWLGKIGTFLQLMLVLATLLAPDLERLHAALGLWVARGLWWTVSAVALASCVDYILEGVRQLVHGRRRAAEAPAP